MDEKFQGHPKVQALRFERDPKTYSALLSLEECEPEHLTSNREHQLRHLPENWGAKMTIIARIILWSPNTNVTGISGYKEKQ